MGIQRPEGSTRFRGVPFVWLNAVLSGIHECSSAVCRETFLFLLPELIGPKRHCRARCPESPHCIPARMAEL